MKEKMKYPKLLTFVLDMVIHQNSIEPILKTAHFHILRCLIAYFKQINLQLKKRYCYDKNKNNSYTMFSYKNGFYHNFLLAANTSI